MDNILCRHGFFGCSVAVDDTHYLGVVTCHLVDKLEELESLRLENARLQKQIEGHCQRIAAQSELLSQKAEK